MTDLSVPATSSPRSTTGAASGSEKALRIAGAAGAVFLGAVLLVAVWAKAIVPSAFVEEISTRGLGFLVGPAAVAYLALALEAGLGVLLLLDVRRLWVLVPSALLVAFFLFLTGQDYVNALRGVEAVGASCGCFGNLVQRTPAEAFWQDLALLVPPLVLAFFGRGAQRRSRTVPPVRTALGVAAAAGAVLLAWKAPELPLDDWATRLRPGVQVGALCAGEGSERVCLDTVVPELEEGTHLVVLTDLGEEFGERAEPLNAYADHRMMTDDSAPPLWVVTTAGPEERQEFFWTHAPGFDPRQAPEALMAPLYRTLPRSFLAADGEVTETWNGLPPVERWMNDTDPNPNSGSTSP